MLEAVEAVVPGLAEPLTFAVRSGEMLAVTGPAMAGKTALLRALTGENKPSAGSIHRAGAIAFADLPIKAGTTANGLLKSVRPTPAADRTRDALVALGLYGFTSTRASALPESLRASLPLVPILASAAPILVLDGDLDRLSPYCLRPTLQFVRRRRTEGVAIVVATQRDEVLRDSDRILGLSAGRRRLWASPEELLAAERQRSATIKPIASVPSNSIRALTKVRATLGDPANIAATSTDDAIEAVLQGCGQVEVTLQGYRRLGDILIDLLG